MEKKPPKPMTPFDELVTTPQLQTMKLLLPYTPASGRQMLAAVIKFLELKETLIIFRHSRPDIAAQMFGESKGNTPEDILNDLRPYLNAQEIQMIDTFTNMKDMMAVMEMMQSMSSGAASEPGRSGDSSQKESPPFNPVDLIMGMLTPEQQESFRTYSSLFSNGPDSVKNGENKGEDHHGTMDGSSGNEKN